MRFDEPKALQNGNNAGVLACGTFSESLDRREAMISQSDSYLVKRLLRLFGELDETELGELLTV